MSTEHSCSCLFMKDIFVTRDSNQVRATAVRLCGCNEGNM